MIKPIKIKRILRGLTGWSEILQHQLRKNPSAGRSCIFYYHRIAEVDFVDTDFDDRNVTPIMFEKQIAALSEFAEIVPLHDLPNRLSENRGSNGKPLVSITFDDGYANFLSNALPILKRYNAPATMAVVTGLSASNKPAHFDNWAKKNAAKVSSESWRLMNWREMEECVASGLVTLASHSHTHVKASECGINQLQDEVGISAEILQRRFGYEHSITYAYPFGNSILGHVSKDYENIVRSAGFKIAVTTDVGLASSESNLLRLPRIEAHNQDSAASIRAKGAGSIAPLYLNNYFHKAFLWKNRKPANSNTLMPNDLSTPQASLKGEIL